MALSDDQPPTFQNPVVVYTAASNLQAHLIVQMLIENDVEAKAIEDQSGVSLWAMGTLTQFHQPQIWVEQSTAKTAASLILNFEQKTQSRTRAASGGAELDATCEDCGATKTFPASLNGTTQDCPQCGGYLDVGDLAINEDIGTAEE